MIAREKSVFVAYLLWLPFGIFGAHKLYLRRPGMAMLYLLTGGLFLLGWLVDLFTLVAQVDDCNDLIFEHEDYTEYLEDRIDELEDQVEDLNYRLRDR